MWRTMTNHLGLFLTISAKDSVSRLHSSGLPCVFFHWMVLVENTKNHQKPPKTPGTNGTKANLVVTYEFQGLGFSGWQLTTICAGKIVGNMSPSIDKIEKMASKTPMAPFVFVSNFCRKSYDGWSWRWPNTSNCTQ